MTVAGINAARLAATAAAVVAWLAAAPSGATAQEPAPDSPVDASFDPMHEWERATRFRFSTDGPSSERDVKLHLGGRFAVDFLRWDRRNEADSGFEFGALRPLFEMDVGSRSQFRWELDFDDVDSKRGAFDLRLRQEIGRHLALELGQIRFAMGTEYATREENLPLVGEGYTSWLTGRYDLGVRAAVDGAADSLHLEGGATLGSGFGLEGEGKDGPLFLGRATIEPLKAHGPKWLQGLWLGGALALQPDARDELILGTPYQSPVFRTRELHGGRAAWGLLEAGWRCGPFRAGFEAVRGRIEDVAMVGGGRRDIDRLAAWTATVSVFLTGDSPTWSSGRWGPYQRRKGRIPAASFEESPTIRITPAATPVELSVRVSEFDVDDEFFSGGLASSPGSTDGAQSTSVNLTFHVARGTRFSLGAVRTVTEDDLAIFGGRDHDTSFLARFEIDF